MNIVDRLLASLLPPAHHALFWQLVRYGVSGLFITACQAAIYWTLATPMALHAQVANGIATIVAVAIGYATHSRFTFRDQRGAGGHAARGVRFIGVSLVSYALNALWVGIFVGWMQWPTWTPIPAMLCVTPGIVFVLNRKWVFR
ncbi:MAG: GtrA family protein [Sphingobium sp.]